MGDGAGMPFHYYGRVPWGGIAAAKGGHLLVLQWARAQEPPCTWGVGTTCSLASMGGHLGVLKWVRAHEPPCPWGIRTCDLAAKGGQLGVLQWLRTLEPPRPCPWSESTCYWAADCGHLEALQWARAHGCSERTRSWSPDDYCVQTKVTL